MTALSHTPLATTSPPGTISGSRPLSAPPISRGAPAALAIARIAIGLTFLWPFFDKTFGLGFATPAERAWIAGGSPTTGYLGSLDGALAGPFGALAGQAWVDWTFMLGMLLVGGAFTLGIALRPAAFGAVAIMTLMWLAALPLENNPVIDEHVVIAATAVALALVNAGETWGGGRLWRSLDLGPRWALLS